MKKHRLFQTVLSLLLIAVMTHVSLPVQGALSLRIGDINSDGDIDASDALLALQYSVQLCWLDEAEFSMGDVTADSNIDAQDALSILQYSVKLISGFINKGDGTIDWDRYYGIDGEDIGEMVQINDINDAAEVIDKLGGAPAAAEVELYENDPEEFDKLIYNPISREAKKTGQITKYNSTSKLTGSISTDGVTVHYSIPNQVTAYDAVPIEYSIEGFGSSMPLYIEATADEEAARAVGDYYDLALPGNVDVTFVYDGYVVADFDDSVKPVLSGKNEDKQGTSYPSYQASDLICSGTLPLADQIWLKFTYTNTGDTILDCNGNGQICFQPILYKMNNDGEWVTSNKYEMENMVERPTDSIYPGESGEMWVSFNCRGLSSGNYQLRITGKINNEQTEPYWEQSFNWGPGTTFSTFDFSVSKNAEITEPNEVAHGTPRGIVRNGWMRTYEEFMTSYEAITYTDGKIGTMYLQCAPWTEYVVLKIMTGNEDNMKLVRIPVEVESDSIKLYLNEDNQNYVVKEDGTREPMIIAQTMADMRSNTQRGPDAAATIVNDLKDMQEAGINTLSSTIAFGYDTSKYAASSVNNDANKFMMDVARNLGMQMVGYSSYPYEWAGLYSFNVAGVSAPSRGFSDPAINTANAALANYTFQRYADMLFQGSDGTIPLATEDTRGWLRIDYSGIWGINDTVQSNFIEWLKGKFSTIDELNVAYNANYSSFESIDLVSEASAISSAGYTDEMLTFWDNTKVFHEWNAAITDLDLFRSVQRSRDYIDMLEKIPTTTPPKNTTDTVVNPKVIIRTEGANFLTGGIDATTDNAHFRQVYYAQRRNGMIAEIVQASDAVYGHSDYTTMPYTPSEIYELVSNASKQGMTEISMAMYNHMQDIALNRTYGREKYMTDYNISSQQGEVKGAYIVTQTALFPWFKAMYEAGGVPGILWQDYLCNGMCTATQYKELKFFYEKMKEMLETDEGKAWATNFEQPDQSWRETTATAWSYPQEYVENVVSDTPRNCVFEGRYR